MSTTYNIIDHATKQFRAMIEDFNEYEVNSKQILSIKTTPAQISKSKFFNNLVEPIYLLATTMIVKVKP